MPPLDAGASPRSKTLDRALSLIAALLVVAIVDRCTVLIGLFSNLVWNECRRGVLSRQGSPALPMGIPNRWPQLAPRAGAVSLFGTLKTRS